MRWEKIRFYSDLIFRCRVSEIRSRYFHEIIRDRELNHFRSSNTDYKYYGYVIVILSSDLAPQGTQGRRFLTLEGTGVIQYRVSLSRSIRIYFKLLHHSLSVLLFSLWLQSPRLVVDHAVGINDGGVY